MSSCSLKVIIPPKVYAKVMYWVNESKVEVSGFGKIIYRDGAYHVLSAHLLEQENSAASTDIDAEAMGKLMAETIQQEGYLNWWWHSHVNMAVNWSGTDLSTIEELGSNGMCLATVFNKKNQSRTAFYQKGSEDGFTPDFFVDDLPLSISAPTSKEDEETWKKELNEKCRTANLGMGMYSGYSGYNYTPSLFDEDDPYSVDQYLVYGSDDWKHAIKGYYQKKDRKWYSKTKGRWLGYSAKSTLVYSLYATGSVNMEKPVYDFRLPPSTEVDIYYEEAMAEVSSNTKKEAKSGA